MRKTYLLILLCCLFLGKSFSQIKPNLQTLSNFQFLQKKNAIESTNSDIKKLSKAKNSLQNYALTCVQIKTLAELFGDDYARYDFVKFFYQNISDTQNFYEVYDTFIYFSTVLMLHDYIEDLETDKNPKPTPLPTLNFPLLNYPKAESYTGNKNCNFPLSNQDFHLFALDLLDKKSENAKNTRLAQIAQNHCLSTMQAMQFATMLKVEANKLVFLKQAYLRSFDSENFKEATQVFAYNNSKNALLTYIKEQVESSPIEDLPCVVSPESFVQIKQRVKNESMNSKKVKLAKYIVKTKQCFTAKQIKALAMLITMDSYTTEFLKYAYDYTIDKDNFYVTLDAINIGSNKEDVIDYIESKK